MTTNNAGCIPFPAPVSLCGTFSLYSKFFLLAVVCRPNR